MSEGPSDMGLSTGLPYVIILLPKSVAFSSSLTVKILLYDNPGIVGLISTIHPGRTGRAILLLHTHAHVLFSSPPYIYMLFRAGAFSNMSCSVYSRTYLYIFIAVHIYAVC